MADLAPARRVPIGGHVRWKRRPTVLNILCAIGGLGR